MAWLDERYIADFYEKENTKSITKNSTPVRVATIEQRLQRM